MLFVLSGPPLALWRDAEGLAAAIMVSTLIPAVLLWRQSHRLVPQTLTGASLAGTLIMIGAGLIWCVVAAT